MQPILEARNISKFFELESGRELKVLEDVNVSIFENQAVAILGPSGSGKSTLLRIMSGLIDSYKGDVLLKGSKLTGINQEVSLVFQSFALFPWETVFDNIRMALATLHLSSLEAKERIKSAVDLVGLEGFEEAYPRELSGGMKQRVGVARALAMERPILFLDEPFSALDVLTADTLREEIMRIFLSRKTKTTSMVLVTHNIEEALVMADRILVMGSNPGRIREEVRNEIPYPRDPESPRFKALAARIHSLITETFIPDEISTPATLSHSLEILPDVQMIDIIGLLEGVRAEGGNTDIFELATKIHRDFGQLLYLVKAAELLDLVDTPKQRVVLTRMGEFFANSDVNVRKRMLHEVFGQLNIVKKTTALLKTHDTIRMPVDDIIEEVHNWLPNEDPQKLVDTLISWGRFAEYFGYNDDKKEIYLDVGQESQ